MGRRMMWGVYGPRKVSMVPRCGDHVLHRPTGETWVVAYADAERDELAWVGAPDGVAKLSDCDLVTRVSHNVHKFCVYDWFAKPEGADHRRAEVLRLYGHEISRARGGVA